MEFKKLTKMNEPNFNDPFINTNKKINLFIHDIDNPIYLSDIRKKQNNTFIIVGIIAISLYIAFSVYQAKDEAEKRTSKFKHNL